MRTAADEFIGGKPAVYVGFDGALYIARYSCGRANRLGVGAIKVTQPCGRIRTDVLMSEATARSFYWNLDAVP